MEWVLSRDSGIGNMVNVIHPVQTLTPVNNVSVGELIPVSIADEAHSEEDSLSVPSYSEVSAVEPQFNVPRFKVFPLLMFNFSDPKSIISVLQYLHLRCSFV
jgi:hypothetical protein